MRRRLFKRSFLPQCFVRLRSVWCASVGNKKSALFLLVCGNSKCFCSFSTCLFPPALKKTKREGAWSYPDIFGRIAAAGGPKRRKRLGAHHPCCCSAGTKFSHRTHIGGGGREKLLSSRGDTEDASLSFPGGDGVRVRPFKVT